MGEGSGLCDSSSDNGENGSKSLKSVISLTLDVSYVFLCERTKYAQAQKAAKAAPTYEEGGKAYLFHFKEESRITLAHSQKCLD